MCALLLMASKQYNAKLTAQDVVRADFLGRMMDAGLLDHPEIYATDFGKDASGIFIKIHLREKIELPDKFEGIRIKRYIGDTLIEDDEMSSDRGLKRRRKSKSSAVNLADKRSY